MDNISFAQDVFPWLLGTLTTIVGFGVKSLLDYLWLKAPRMAVRSTLTGTITHPPRNGYRSYDFDIEIEIQNHSKNEAYGLQILNIIMPTGLHMQGGFQDKYDHVVSDTTSAKICGKCAITLPVSPQNATATGSERKKDFGNQIKLSYTYKNQLGRSYNKTQTVTFQKNLSIVHSIAVKSFTPNRK